MSYLIGTDEAGYGPNLGPLVIAATAWELPDSADTDDLYKLLSDVVTSAAPKRSKRSTRTTSSTPAKLSIADSKILYRPGGDVSLLELGLLVALEGMGHRPRRFRELSELVCGPATSAQLDKLPWYDGLDISIPSTDVTDRVDQLSVRWQEVLEQAQITCRAIHARVVFPEEFNVGVAKHDSKGAVLSNATLDLVANLLKELPADDNVTIVCDKHGGRNKYGGLLQGRFGPGLVRVVTEGRALSRYEVGTAERSIQIGFQVGGESYLPSALASMLAKYYRELCMKSFNAFWQSHVTNLKPTAGYPVDAKRFKTDIAASQEKLGIPDAQLWRSR